MHQSNYRNIAYSDAGFVEKELCSLESNKYVVDRSDPIDSKPRLKTVWSCGL